MTQVSTGAIVVDLEHCVACRGCETACALAHADFDDMAEALRSGVRLTPRVHVLEAAGEALPVQCQHCTEPACVLVCPSEALYRDEEGGRVLTEPENCIGCKACVRACPYGAVFWNEALQVAVKCDLCEGIIEEGQEPACIRACPTGCRHIGDLEEALKDDYLRALREKRGTVAYSIDRDECICCGRCARECPADCISGETGKRPAAATEEDREKGRVGEPFAIDQSECVECGTCLEVCPAGAVIREQTPATQSTVKDGPAG